MQVLQIIDSLNVGGAQQLQLTLAQAARASGTLSLAVLSLRADGDSTLARELRGLGVTVQSVPVPSPFHPAVVARLARCVRTVRPNVVHTHLTNANIAGAVAARLAGAPVVATLHNVWTRRWQRLEALVLQTTARIAIGVGRSVAAAYRPWLGRLPLEVVPNPVGTIDPLLPGERAALRETVAGDAGRPLLLAVGRLAPQKGYEDLLAAMANLRERHPNFCLAIVAQGQ
jgi:glycosyltransferase involved in cell wall biosynthesis